MRTPNVTSKLGLTLKEVAEYYYDTKNMDIHLARLTALRTSLDRNIQMLQVRSAKPGDLTVHKTILPRVICYCRRYVCENIVDASNKLRDTYIAAARTGKMSMLDRMFTMRMCSQTEKLDLMCCIPIDSSYNGPERTEFAETPALCIYYRGPYEGTANAIQTLMKCTFTPIPKSFLRQTPEFLPKESLCPLPYPTNQTTWAYHK